jgi:hypothetical protein
LAAFVDDAVRQLVTDREGMVDCPADRATTAGLGARRHTGTLGFALRLLRAEPLVLVTEQSVETMVPVPGWPGFGS